MTSSSHEKRGHTDAKFKWYRQQWDALETRPVPARRGCQRVGRKRSVADAGVTTNTSRISITAGKWLGKDEHELATAILTRRNSV